jgi:VanZ family protein
MPATNAPALRRLAKPLAACTAAYTVVLVAATHYPNPQELLEYNSLVQSDKTLHFIAYGILGLLVGATLASAGRHTLRTLALALLALALFAAVDEATQPLFGRYADVLDWGYDCIGLVGGIALATTVIGCFSRTSPTR